MRRRMTVVLTPSRFEVIKVSSVFPVPAATAGTGRP
jgi:hypothetical protein